MHDPAPTITVSSESSDERASYGMQAWVKEMAGFVKSIAPKQLVGVGDEGFASFINDADNSDLVSTNPGERSAPPSPFPPRSSPQSKSANAHTAVNGIYTSGLHIHSLVDANHFVGPEEPTTFLHANSFTVLFEYLFSGANCTFKTGYENGLCCRILVCHHR